MTARRARIEHFMANRLTEFRRVGSWTSESANGSWVRRYEGKSGEDSIPWHQGSYWTLHRPKSSEAGTINTLERFNWKLMKSLSIGAIKYWPNRIEFGVDSFQNLLSNRSDYHQLSSSWNHVVEQATKLMSQANPFGSICHLLLAAFTKKDINTLFGTVDIILKNDVG